MNGGLRQYFGSVTLVSADNLASNAVGGFKESPSAYRPCRQCLGTNVDIREWVKYFSSHTVTHVHIHSYTHMYNIFFFKFEEEHFELRTLNEHLRQCDIIADGGDDADDNSKEFGVNSRSSLLELKHFNMCSGALIPDVMHDLLEGALQHILKLLLHYLMEEKKYFSLSYLNQKIQGMEFGYMDDNRPSPIGHGDKRLRQNGEKQIHVINEQ